MPYFTTLPTKRLTLPSNPDYWVEVATDFHYGDVKRFFPSTADERPNVEGDAFLEVAIKNWNLDDEAGNIVEINLVNIDKLSKDDAVFLITEVGALISDEEDPKKNKNSTKA